jgi:hypothetical protein
MPELCKEALVSVVLRFLLALLFLVLPFSLAVRALTLRLLPRHLAPERRGKKRLPLRTTIARTTSELA